MTALLCRQALPWSPRIVATLGTSSPGARSRTLAALVALGAAGLLRLRVWGLVVQVAAGVVPALVIVARVAMVLVGAPDTARATVPVAPTPVSMPETARCEATTPPSTVPKDEGADVRGEAAPAGHTAAGLAATYYPGSPTMDYEPGTLSAIALDDPYAVAREVDRDLIHLPLTREQRRAYTIPLGSVVAMVRFSDPGSDLADRVDVVFTPTQTVVVSRYQMNAGVFVGADVYPLPVGAAGVRTLGGATPRLVAYLEAAMALHGAARAAAR